MVSPDHLQGSKPTSRKGQQFFKKIVIKKIKSYGSKPICQKNYSNYLITRVLLGNI